MQLPRPSPGHLGMPPRSRLALLELDPTWVCHVSMLCPCNHSQWHCVIPSTAHLGRYGEKTHGYNFPGHPPATWECLLAPGLECYSWKLLGCKNVMPLQSFLVALRHSQHCSLGLTLGEHTWVQLPRPSPGHLGMPPCSRLEMLELK